MTHAHVNPSGWPARSTGFDMTGAEVLEVLTADTDPNADLAGIRTKWLRFCNSHDDLDIPVALPCICPTEDHRPVIAALVTEVETLRAEVARLEGERDEVVTALSEANDARGDLIDTVLRQRRKIQYLMTELALAEAERDQARAVRAVLHAEAVRLRAALDLAERDKAHALVEQMLDVRDLLAVDQMAPSRPHLPPQSDERGEVAGTDTVEAQEGTQPAPTETEKRGDARLRWMDEIDATDRSGEVGRDV